MSLHVSLPSAEYRPSTLERSWRFSRIRCIPFRVPAIGTHGADTDRKQKQRSHKVNVRTGYNKGRRLIALLALFALVPLLVPGVVAAHGPAPAQGVKQLEIRFMQEMIDHHTMAVHIAMACVSKSDVRQPIRDLCQDIISTQAAETQKMTAWLAEWYGIDYTPSMGSPGQMEQMHRMMMLNGSEFEVAFMKSMIQHHWGAVVASKQVVDRGYHEALVRLAGEIIAAQTAEIEMLQGWLATWHGIPKFGPRVDKAAMHNR
jgi:uncharacterized protein (DUF305 family)